MERLLEDLPRQPAWFHPVGQGHVVAPDVELPLPESDDPAEDVSGVNADPHVDVGVGHLSHVPEIGQAVLMMTEIKYASPKHVILSIL